MSDLLLFCLIDSESCSTAFPINIPSTATVHELKKAIKEEKPINFSTIDADKLVLWRVTVPLNDNDSQISLRDIEHKSRPLPVAFLSSLFPDDPEKEAIHIIVQQPPQVDRSSSLTRFEVNLQTFCHTRFTWTTDITRASLSELRGTISVIFPNLLDGTETIAVVHNKRSESLNQGIEGVNNDDQLRTILRYNVESGILDLTLDMVTPLRPLSSYTFADVNRMYDFTPLTQPNLSDVPTFQLPKGEPTETPDHKRSLALLCQELESRIESGFIDAESIITPFLVHSVALFKNQLRLTSKRHLEGRRGQGSVHYCVESTSDPASIMSVTKVASHDFEKAVAESMVQLESISTGRKRKFSGDTTPLVSYGVVTDAKEWRVVECSLESIHSRPKFRVAKVPGDIRYDSEDWHEDVKKVFERVVSLVKATSDPQAKRSKRDIPAAAQ
ncbi:hypothetical protein B0O80DRAFT_429098 [Mortierella sp. GBAus27b]|nr:hypothetical protein BGX31_011318 [Mortierella sp. GBA43]KAI8349313.1 hypothetical protein B0O80DRAFT_429098 [Mortierella sp. GBAus27b]